MSCSCLPLRQITDVYNQSISTRAIKQMVLRERMEPRIHFLRGQRVMLSSDLAPLYSVPVRALVQALRHNESRFPDFPLSANLRRVQILEVTICEFKLARRPQSASLRLHRGRSDALQRLAERALRASQHRHHAHLGSPASPAGHPRGSHEDLRRKMEQREKRYDAKFSAVFATLKQVLEVPLPRKKEIGFHARPGRQKYSH